MKKVITVYYLVKENMLLLRLSQLKNLMKTVLPMNLFSLQQLGEKKG